MKRYLGMTPLQCGVLIFLGIASLSLMGVSAIYVWQQESRLFQVDPSMTTTMPVGQVSYDPTRTSIAISPVTQSMPQEKSALPTLIHVMIPTTINASFEPRIDTPLTTSTPDNITIIGYSIAGRALSIYRFGNGSVERMIIAGIHGGNEYNTVLLASQLIQYLEEHPESVPKEITLFVLPDLNPDGFFRSWDIYGRANGRGVDLNHNFPSNWQKDWDREGCWRYLRLNGGENPASEPETWSLINFIITHRIDTLISYHSAALGIFPGGVPADSASKRLAKAVAAVSEYPYPPVATGCEYTGSLADWAVTQGIAAIEIELTNHTDTDFEQNLNILSVFLNWKR